MSWAHAYAYRQGADHERCDDVCVCDTMGDVIFAAVSDGAGSAPRAREGATLACQVFAENAIAIYSGQAEPSCLISAIHERLPQGELDLYSCTLVGAVIGKRDAFFVQVGDGAAVIRTAVPSPTRRGGAVVAEKNDYRLAIAPAKTEFLNQTYFVTAANAEEHLQANRIGEVVTELALFTDGLQHLVIDLKDDLPHKPFFDKVFETLSSEKGHDTRTSWWLERTLASDAVTKRTDDDTSIIVARRLSC